MEKSKSLLKSGTPLQFQNNLVYWMLLTGVLVYLALFGYNSLTRTRLFSPDSMNYVDVAQNIIAGKGVSQSAVRFNEPHFSVDGHIWTPLITQPPVYPLLIVLFSQFGISTADAALLISVIAYGVALLVTFRLAYDLYDKRVAILSLCLMLFYFPFQLVSRYAWSEPPAIVFLLTTLWLLTRLEFYTKKKTWILILAGLTTGLAFATRYALLPLFGIGILFLALELRSWKEKMHLLSLYIVGFAVPASLVLARNLRVANTLLPNANPSEVSAIGNTIRMAQTLIGQYLNVFPIQVEVILFGVSSALISVLLIRKYGLVGSFRHISVSQKRYVLTVWTLGYLAFIIYQRSRTHFDPINSRIIAPAAATIVLLVSAYVVEAIQPTAKRLTHLALILITIAILSEVRITVRLPIFNADQLLANSERLTWIVQHTTERDLIIGEETVDVVFLLDRPTAVTFSPYPYTDHPTYEQVTAFSNKHCHEYEHVYLVLSHQYGEEKDSLYYYGPFITDIVRGRMQQYPDVSLIRRLSDGYVFEIGCQPEKNTDQI